MLALDSDETAESGDCTAPITLATFDAMSAPDGSTDDSDPAAVDAIDDAGYGAVDLRAVVDVRPPPAADCTAPIALATPSAMSLPDGSTADSGAVKDEGVTG